MKRRILSLALVLALVLSLMPLGIVSAESEHVHCMCGAETTKDAVCADCGTKAVVWTGIDKMPATNAPGHYYLKKDVAASPTFLTSGEFSFCLCGHDLTSAAGKRILDVAKSGTKLNITDCTEEPGSVTGATGASATGSALCVNSSAELNLYNGRIVGNTAASNGVILVSGGTFNMYGGEISGNTSGRGAVYLDNAASVGRFLGGQITGNTGKNTGAMGGGAGVYGMKGTIELGGTVRICGNTAAESSRNGDLYLRNDQGAKLTLSSAVPLQTGAEICYGTWTPESDTTNLQYITGTPAVWSSSWLRYNGTKVGYADSKFFLDATADHIHCLCGKETAEGNVCSECKSEAVLWEGTNAFPTADGYYYLSDTVKTAKVELKANVKLCLHGKNLESAAGATVFKTMPGYTFQLTDCSGTAGSVTGTTATTAIEVQINSTFVLWNGKITGNTGTGNGTVWVAQGTASLPGGNFTMYGGEISGNTAGRGAVFTGTTTGVKQATVRLLGGKITGNTGTNTGGTGGGAGVYALSPVEIGGNMQIFGNTAKVEPADLFLRNDGAFTGKLTVSSEVPLTDGANICYGLKVAETDPTNLTYITGTPSAWNKAWVSYAGDPVSFADGKFFTKEVPKHVHCLCGAETTLGNTCASCGSQAVSWTGTNKLPTKDEPGYYYFTDDVSAHEINYANGGQFGFCLNGHTLKSAGGSQILEVFQGAAMHITDCGTTGTITGVTGKTTYGSLMRVNQGAELTLWNGTITGNTAADDGLIYVDGSNDTAVSGGTFTMYGGEITGNTVRRGAVYGVSTGKNPPVIKLLGGTITGNTGTGTGNRKGGAGVYSFFPVEVGGNVQISGNTAAEGPADLFLRNDSTYGGKVTVSSEKPLTDGADISYSLWTAEADPMNLQNITGTPTAWNMEWIKYDGVKVGYEDGRFYTKYALDYANHDHEGKTWVSVTQENRQWPAADGCYVLESDVTLEALITIAKGDHVQLCLNGHTLTAPANSAHFDVYGKLTVCDCTAKTVKGTYTAGSITGGTGKTGGSLRLRPTGELYLIDGIFTGNACAEGGNGGVVYADAGAYIKMTGGQMCGNTGSMGGAVRLGAPNVDGPFCTFILEGGSICHNESINMGGGVYAAGGADIQLIGGNISDNKAAEGGGGIGVNSQAIDGTKLVSLPTVIDLTGTTISNNTATTWGGNVYIKTGTVLNMQGGVISGGTSKVGAGILMESQGTTLNFSGGRITENKAGAAGAAAVYASNNTVVNMTGGEVTNNVSEAGGGGIVLYAAKASFTGGKITGNYAAGGGGGLHIQGSEVLLGKVLIDGNKTNGSSGGVYISRAGSVNSNVVIDGAQITNNTCKTSGGGIFLYMNGNKVTMESGLIAGNKAADGGGVVAQRAVTFIYNGGEIRGNQATSNGGGFYASIDSTFQMNGGKISGNSAGKGGGGLYCLRSDVTLSGGTITGNKAKTSGGGATTSGAKVKLCGTTISYNSCEGSGAGIVVQASTATVDGVKTIFKGQLTMTGSTITGNTSPKAAGGVLVNGKNTEFNFISGTISYNVTDKFGSGIYVGKNGVMNMSGGSVCYNESKLDTGAGIRIDGGTVNITGGEIHHNKVTRSAGGLMIGSQGTLNMSGVKIYENEAKVGAGLLVQGKAKVLVEDCEIYRNVAFGGEAAGVYVGTYTNPVFKNVKIYENTAEGNGAGMWSWATSNVTLEGCEFTDNVAQGEGGGVWTRGDTFEMIDTRFVGNRATGHGGGFGSGIMGAATPRETPGVIMDGCSFENNTTDGMGGGAYFASGAKCTMSDTVFRGNVAQAEGGAFWAKDETTLHSVEATGNQSGGAGFAVYIGDSDYDGHSYVAGLHKMSGSMRILDNQNGDLYLGKETAVVIPEEGLSQDAEIRLTMHSGLLTDWVWGSYNYEGGDLQYTITYGDRSMTDPEQKAPPAAAEAQDGADTAGNNWILYVAVGGIAVLLLAAVLVVLGKKKAGKK